MGDVINAGGRFRATRQAAIAGHKFPVGASVVCRIGVRSEALRFEVLRQMPDGGFGFQYRLKAVADGHERVALESALAFPGPDDGVAGV
jgi:hypothetical protein